MQKKSVTYFKDSINFFYSNMMELASLHYSGSLYIELIVCLQGKRFAFTFSSVQRMCF